MPTLSSKANPTGLPVSPGAGTYRWRICALLFFATTINYIDRQVISILKPSLMSGLGWNELDYSNVVFAFQCAYALGYAGGGWFMDRVGTKVGYAVAVLGWSLAGMGHALVSSVAGFSVARFALGIFEGGNFPGAIKTVGEWFPVQERALATGIFNAGCNVAVVLTPLFVPWIALRWGWQGAFFATGALGLLWLIAWQMTYRSPKDHPKVSPAELAYISSGTSVVAEKISWLELLKYRQTWSFTAGMVMVAPVWWFYLFWVPGFLHDRHGLNLKDFGPPLVVIYLIADIGSIAGGWLSSQLIKRGWSVNRARKTTMLLFALCVLPVGAAGTVSSLWLATALIGLAAAAHQGFAANLYTLVSDTAPQNAVSTVVGIGGMASAIAGMLAAKVIGYVLQWTGNYAILFGSAACAYLLALLAIHVLNPNLEPMKITAAANKNPPHE